jgi:hypothetical protein
MGALGINSVAFFCHKFRNREGDKENEDAAAIASMVVCLSLVYNSKPQQKNTKKSTVLTAEQFRTIKSLYSWVLTSGIRHL